MSESSTPAARRRRRGRHAALRGALILFAVIALGACSTTRLVYNNLDWLAFEALDDRFDIRSDQADWVKARLAALHDWHRATQLPAYRQTLEGLAERFADGLQPTDLGWLETRLEQHRRALVERSVPDLAQFLADLDDTQLARFAEVSGEAIEEAAEPLDWSVKRRRAQRLDTYVERIEPWTGQLTADQVEGLERDLADLPDIRSAWLEQRRARRQAFLELLAGQPDAVVVEAALYGWWYDLEAAYPPAYTAQRREFRTQLFATVRRLDSRLTPRQRARVTDRLETYVSTIDTVLAAR